MEMYFASWMILVWKLVCLSVGSKMHIVRTSCGVVILLIINRACFWHTWEGELLSENDILNSFVHVGHRSGIVLLGGSFFAWRQPSNVRQWHVNDADCMVGFSCAWSWTGFKIVAWEGVSSFLCVRLIWLRMVSMVRNRCQNPCCLAAVILQACVGVCVCVCVCVCVHMYIYIRYVNVLVSTARRR